MYLYEDILYKDTWKVEGQAGLYMLGGVVRTLEMIVWTPIYRSKDGGKNYQDDLRICSKDISKVATLELFLFILEFQIGPLNFRPLPMKIIELSCCQVQNND